MQNAQNEELAELRTQLSRLGDQLAVRPRAEETYPEFARRMIEAARRLRLSAGITWADYELIRADKTGAWFGLKKPPDASPLGGPRWGITVGQGLEELAGKLGMYEDGQA